MTVNIVSESDFFGKDQGVHTAYKTIVAMVRRKKVTVTTNSLKASDITHIHTLGLFGLYSLKRAKHSVVSAHVVPQSFVGSLKGTKYWLPLGEKYLRYFYSNADLVLAVAPRVKDQLRAINVTSRIEVFPNPVNTEHFYPDEELRKKGKKLLAIEEDTLVFLGVGQVQPRKGIADFITLATNYPKHLFIWVGGKPFKALTADDHTLDELISHPPANFFIKGPFDYKDMPAIYNAADVFLFPSFQENAPMCLIEAAACGLPLVLRNIPEYKYLYHEGYIRCDSVEDFAKEIKKLSENKEYYKKAVIESKTLAKKYSIDELGDKLISYYQSLLA